MLISGVAALGCESCFERLSSHGLSEVQATPAVKGRALSHFRFTPPAVSICFSPPESTPAAVSARDEVGKHFQHVLQLSLAGPLGVVTPSAGPASSCPGSLTATQAWLVEEADAALDEAKGAGRNTFAVRPNVEIGAQAALKRAQKGSVRPVAGKQTRKTSQPKHLLQVHPDSRRS
jgi:hypothetical protein